MPYLYYHDIEMIQKNSHEEFFQYLLMRFFKISHSQFDNMTFINR